MEAQQIITMSINKITGSRGQRGGVNLRKNLLVATVLHSARAIYYEEMCNRMARNSADSESNSRDRDMNVDEEDDDFTEAPDWGDAKEDSSTRSLCERVENHVSRQEQQQPAEDKENVLPSVTKPLSVQAKQAEATTEPDCVTEEKSDKDRMVMVLGQKNTNSSVYSGCNACKRKRSDSSEELREACESILPKRAKSSDSDCQTEDINSLAARRNSDGSITSLVSIFKSGFHGLSGEPNAKPKTSNIVSGPSTTSNHLKQSSYASSMPRPFDQLPMPIAAC